MSVQVHFLPDQVTVEAQVGELLLGVAERAGVCIPTGCLMGSCCACEVEVGGDNIRACITAIPAGPSDLTVNLFTDPSW